MNFSQWMIVIGIAVGLIVLLMAIRGVKKGQKETKKTPPPRQYTDSEIDAMTLEERFRLFQSF